MVPYGPRGTRLWSAYCEKAVGEGGLALLEELCRTADRLDRLDALLIGDAEVWQVVEMPRSGNLELQIDSALSEARQQASAFRQLLAALPLKERDDADADDWLDNLPSSLRDSEGRAVPDAGA